MVTRQREGSVAGLRMRDLRRDRSLAPGGADFARLLNTFLPAVYGSAGWLIPENPGAAEDVVVAVFQSLGYRWRKTSRRTLLAPWLLRTTWFAAVRERKRLHLPELDPASAARQYNTLWKALYRLRSGLVNAVILRGVLLETPERVGQALRIKPPRVEKQTERALAKLAKALRRRRIISEPRHLLERAALPPPAGLETRVLEPLVQWTPKERKSKLVRATLRKWQWVGFFRRMRRLGATLAIVACLLVALGVTMAHLVRQGYFVAWMIQNSQRQLAKDMPEIKEPARPWPVSPSDQSLVAQRTPRNAAELYSLTNIWIAKLSFTSEQWEGIAPSHVRPVKNLMGDDGKIVLRNPAASRSGLAGALGIDFNWVKGRLEFGGRTFPEVAVRYRGNGTYINSLFGPKQSFKMDLNKFTKKQSIAGIDELNFLNSIADHSYLRDALAEQLFRDLGVPAPRTAYAYLTVDVPGTLPNQPLGLYVLVENIDGDFAADRFGSKKTPIFKPVTYDLFKHLGDDWNRYAAIYDLKTEATPQQLSRVIEFAQLVTQAENSEFARRLPEFLDVEEFAAFVAGHVLLSSYDGFLTNGQNYYLYLDPRSNKFGFISWDQDHSWGEFGYIGRTETRERASIWQPAVYQNYFLDRVMNTEVFQAVYRRQLERALDGPFTVDHLYAQVDHLASIIRPAIEAESSFRLQRFDQSISSDWTSAPRRGPPEGPKAPVHQIKRFITNRAKSVREQLDGTGEGVALMRQSR